MDILKEEKCQGQLVANPNEYYMEDECTYYYHEQTTTTHGNEETAEEIFFSQVLRIFWESALIYFVSKLSHWGVKKWFQFKWIREKEESIKTFSTLALIPEIQRVQEGILLELSNEQIEDIKIEKLPKFILILF